MIFDKNKKRIWPFFQMFIIPLLLITVISFSIFKFLQLNPGKSNQLFVDIKSKYDQQTDNQFINTSIVDLPHKKVELYKQDGYRILSTNNLEYVFKSNYYSLESNIDAIDFVMYEHEDLETTLNDTLPETDIPIIATLHLSVLEDYLTTATNTVNIELLDELLDKLKSKGYQGIQVDVSGYDSYNEDFVQTVLAHVQVHVMYSSLKMNLIQSINQKIIPNIDLIQVQAYKDLSQTTSIEPISDTNWFRDRILSISSLIPKGQLVFELGQIGYEWNKTLNTPPIQLTYDQILNLANIYPSKLQSDTQNNLSFTYRDGNQHDYFISYLDSTSYYNELKTLNFYNENNIALSIHECFDEDVLRLFFSNNIKNFDTSELKTIDSPIKVIFEGKGPFLNVIAKGNIGSRIFKQSNYIYSQVVKQIPKNYNVHRFGDTSNKTIVLTFDDGPNKKYTPEILKILKQYNIEATFFMLGTNIEGNQSLVRKIIEDGHTIGNHSFTHPSIRNTSLEQFTHDVYANQLLINGYTGYTPTLFRAPENTDLSPNYYRLLDAFYDFNQHHLITVNNTVDSKDYIFNTSEEIVQEVLKSVSEQNTNILLFHDGISADESTIKAIKTVIPLLLEQGYTFKSFEDLYSVPKEQVLIKNTNSMEYWFQYVLMIWFYIQHFFRNFTYYLFVIAEIVVYLRFISLFFLFISSLKQRRMEKKNFNREDLPFVSIIIPAYNEEKVIERTIKSLLNIDYPNYEILIIDDGSKDLTHKRTSKYLFKSDKIRLIHKPNGGKYTALNLGFIKAKADYVVTLDADTIVYKDTIKYLILPFLYLDCDAVCGNVKVGNPHNLLTKLQRLEYITGQNYDRRALEVINAIMVVPGATGAWKKSKILEIGGYSNETLTEDADLTLTLLKNNGKIVYSQRGYSYTEVPEKISELYKQRFRWTYGTLQVLWKHRRYLLNLKKGWFVISYLLLFQILLPISTFLLDILLVYLLFQQQFSKALFLIGINLIFELFFPLLAIFYDKEKYRQLLVFPFVRFFYRQFIYLTNFFVMFSVLKGNSKGWNKLERMNSINTNT